MSISSTKRNSGEDITLKESRLMYTAYENYAQLKKDGFEINQEE